MHGLPYTQFHNTYIEILVSGGILELIYVLYIYFNVYKKLINSDIDKKIRNRYLCFGISYFIYMLSESLGRFSIGYADTICMICFVTIPLLYSNSLKE